MKKNIAPAAFVTVGGYLLLIAVIRVHNMLNGAQFMDATDMIFSFFMTAVRLVVPFVIIQRIIARYL